MSPYGSDDYPDHAYSPAGSPPGTTRNEDNFFVGHRLGLIPSQGRPAIPFGEVLKAAAFDMVVPNAADHISGVPGWNLGANNQYGTCGPTGLANFMTMAYWNLLGVQVIVKDADIFALYEASGNPGFPAQDNGVDLNYMLTQAMDVGLTVTYTGVTGPNFNLNLGSVPVAGSTEVVKPVAFGSLDTTDLADVKATTAVLGGVEMGVVLQTAQQAQTALGCWDFSASPVWGGHAILGAAYTGNTSGADEEVVTWAKPVGTTDGFIGAQLSQAYAIVLPIHLTHPAFLEGVDVTKLGQLFTELTGRPFPA